MLRSQRILLIIGLLIIAWLMSVNVCDWVFNDEIDRRVGSQQREIWAWVASERPVLDFEGKTVIGTVKSYTGLFTEAGVNHTVSFTLGVIAPLLMLLAVMYLLLGARHAARVKRGLCIKCGYDLRGLKEPAARCPECGAATTDNG